MGNRRCRRGLRHHSSPQCSGADVHALRAEQSNSSTRFITFTKKQLSEIYNIFPEVEFVTISDFQRQHETMPRMRTIHHGIDLNAVSFAEQQAALLLRSWGALLPSRVRT